MLLAIPLFIRGYKLSNHYAQKGLNVGIQIPDYASGTTAELHHFERNISIPQNIIYRNERRK